MQGPLARHLRVACVPASRHEGLASAISSACYKEGYVDAEPPTSDIGVTATRKGDLG